MQKTTSSEAQRLLQTAITDGTNVAAAAIVDAKVAFGHLEALVLRARQSGMLDKDPQVLLTEMSVMARSAGGYVTEILSGVADASRRLAEAAKLRSIVEKSNLKHADKRFLVILDGTPDEYSWDELLDLASGEPADDPADMSGEVGNENLREWALNAEIGDEYKFEEPACSIHVRREI